MNKRLFVAAVVLLLVVPATFVAVRTRATGGDPCDNYGDCVSSSITFIRSNPDGSLYLGDSFSVSVSITSGQNTSSYSISWSFDSSVFQRTGSTFTVAGNKTGIYTISASVTFTGSIQVGNTTQPFTSTLLTSQTVSIIPMNIQFRTTLVNVTDARGRLLRNPDGSFYRNDSFCDSWSATFAFASERTDIKINVTSVINPKGVLRVLNYSSDPLGRSGRFCYAVGIADPAYAPYNATLVARALNWQGISLGLKSSELPFAVVQYHPFFTYFTYMLYNDRNFTTYQRPFVTLVRYGGNDPGYNYRGDTNTAPIRAGNDTAERAWIDNFSFSTKGWAVKVNYSPQPIKSQGIQFVDEGQAEVPIRTLNKTLPVITWGNRVQKYYFYADQTAIGEYVADGTIYLNVTESAYSSDFAGGTYGLFNTTYLYEPVPYTGYVTFVLPPTQNGGDNNVTLTVTNPHPLDPSLINEVRATFGNDNGVIEAFRADLYPAYNQTQMAKPVSLGANGTTFTFDLNQTNLAFPGEPMPSFMVSISNGGSRVTYTLNDTFSLFELNRVEYPASPFQNITNLFVAPASSASSSSLLPASGGEPVLGQPLNYTLGEGTGQMELRDYDVSGSWAPPTTEPGDITQLYPFPYPYGMSHTVYVNLNGSGVDVISSAKNGADYHVTLAISAQSGGITQVNVIGRDGSLIYSSAALSAPYSETGSFYPGLLGTSGIYSFQFSPSENTTASVMVENTWGVWWKAGSVAVSAYSPPPPPYPEWLVLFLAFFLLGSFILGSFIRGRKVAARLASEA